MSLGLSSAQNHGGYLANTNSVGEAEFKISQARKTSKTYRKRRDGTEGLDAVDEHDDSDRLKEGFDLMNGDD